jgi:DNA-binding NarL/FixJ family response regulator
MKLISDDAPYNQRLMRSKQQLLGLPLTPREQQVWAMVAQGLMNKEIAKGMGIQEGTVKQHVWAAMAKLECRSRTELALKYEKLYANGRH